MDVRTGFGGSDDKSSSYFQQNMHNSTHSTGDFFCTMELAGVYVRGTIHLENAENRVLGFAIPEDKSRCS